MKHVVFATRSPFWRRSNGAYSRARSLLEFLSQHTQLKILLVDSKGADDLESKQEYGELTWIPPEKIGTADGKQWLRDWFLRTPCDVVIADRIGSSLVATTTPTRVKTMLDCNDIASERTTRMLAKGIAPIFSITPENERRIFQTFDFILAIQEREQRSAEAMVGPEKVILAPHPPPLRKRAVRETAKRIGLVASQYAPNVHGLRWFLKEVWPKLESTDVTLSVYGEIRSAFEGDTLPPRVEFLGRVDDLEPVYDSLDIVINPVPTGAGLKIKTVEALGAGLPLVTTSEGARGLESVSGRVFACADEPEDFASHLNRLLASRDERERLSAAGYAFAESSLSPEACFGALLKEIEAPLQRAARQV